MITLTKNFIFSTIIGISLLVFTILFLFKGNNYLVSIFIFLYFISVPGALIILSLRLKNDNSWTSLLLSIGLSLAFLLTSGLIFNWTWPLFFNSSPLEKGLMNIYYIALVGFLISTAYLRYEGSTYKISITFFNKIKNIYFLVPPTIFIISLLAPVYLNNTGNGFLAILTTIGISITLFFITIYYKKINSNFFPWSIYFFSLSLLSLLSLRSWYASGWDIQNELVMFQITKTLGVWSPANWHDAYNACLSITLLPTVFSNLTSFPDDYIYKFFYQVLFAFTPLIIFQTYKKFTEPFVAFIAVIYIIAQPLFVQPMTALMRQEIAFLFFTLMLFVIFNQNLTNKVRNLLFIIFGLNMVVSHYSTTYISLLLLLSTYSITSFFKISEKIKIISILYKKLKISDKKISYKYNLNPTVLLVLLFFTIFWYGYVNNYLGQVQKVMTEGLLRMNELFYSEVNNSESRKAVSFLESERTTSESLQNYTEHEISKIQDRFNLYPPESYANNNVEPTFDEYVEPKIESFINKYLFITLEIIKQIFKIFVILGPLYLFIRFFSKEIYPREYIALLGIAVFIIIVMTFHPSLGLEYNLSRFSLQLLFYLSLPSILFGLFLLKPIRKYSNYIIGILITIIFIYLVGIPYQLFGGEASMYYNNFGENYNMFYLHKEELSSAEWIKKHVNERSILFADRGANLRIYRMTTRYSNQNVLPALIYKNSYVYGSYSNSVNNRSSIYSNGFNLLFTFPNSFLKNNKDLIYNNGGSDIYK